MLFSQTLLPVSSRPISLALLERSAGIVAARREGKWMHYSVTAPADPSAAQLLHDVRKMLANDPEMKRDRERLLKVCCSPNCPERIAGAPLPASIRTALLYENSG